MFQYGSFAVLVSLLDAALCIALPVEADETSLDQPSYETIQGVRSIAKPFVNPGVRVTT